MPHASSPMPSRLERVGHEVLRGRERLAVGHRDGADGAEDGLGVGAERAPEVRLEAREKRRGALGTDARQHDDGAATRQVHEQPVLGPQAAAEAIGDGEEVGALGRRGLHPHATTRNGVPAARAANAASSAWRTAASGSSCVLLGDGSSAPSGANDGAVEDVAVGGGAGVSGEIVPTTPEAPESTR